MLDPILILTAVPPRYQVERLDRPFDQTITSGIVTGTYVYWADAIAKVDDKAPSIITDLLTGEQWRCVRWGQRVVATPVRIDAMKGAA